MFGQILARSFVPILSYMQDAGYFTSDNEPGGIENATHNTFPT
jgi:hypothetical protein